MRRLSKPRVNHGIFACTDALCGYASPLIRTRQIPWPQPAKLLIQVLAVHNRTEGPRRQAFGSPLRSELAFAVFGVR
jgi:hypothetical protein